VKRWTDERDRRGTRPHVSIPREVGCWTRASSTKGGQVVFGERSGLPRVTPPSTPVDLNEGYPDSFIRKPEGEHPGVEVVVDAVAAGGSVGLTECDVVTFRNNLNKIGKTPFDARNAWEVDACFLGNTLFLDIREDPSGGAQSSYADQDRFQYFGYKFEALCTGHPAADATSEFCAVMRTRIGNLRIVLAAEVDGCDGENDEFVELKTSRTPQHPGQIRTLLKFKYPRWWLQSWLAGIKHILVGSWTSNGQLEQIQRLRTTDLPRLSAEKGESWDPWESIHFMHDTLTWMRDLARQYEGQHIRFVYCGNRGSILAKIVPQGDLRYRLSKKRAAPNQDGLELKKSRLGQVELCA